MIFQRRYDDDRRRFCSTPSALPCPIETPARTFGCRRSTSGRYTRTRSWWSRIQPCPRRRSGGRSDSSCRRIRRSASGSFCTCWDSGRPASTDDWTSAPSRWSWCQPSGTRTWWCRRTPAHRRARSSPRRAARRPPDRSWRSTSWTAARCRTASTAPRCPAIAFQLLTCILLRVLRPQG